MRVLEVEVPGGKNSQAGFWRLYGLGDLHLDLRRSDWGRLRRYIDIISADPHGVAIQVGDIIDGTTPRHKFYDPNTIRPHVLENMNRYTDVMLELAEDALAPIVDAGVPLVILKGNHDIREGNRWVGFPEILTRLLARRPSAGPVLYGSTQTLIRVRATHPYRDRDGSRWVVFCEHGSGGSAKPGGKVNRHADTAPHIADADIYLRGHVEEGDVRVLKKASITSRGAARLKLRPQCLYTAAGFASRTQEGVEGYPAEKSMPPVDQGILWIEVWNPYTGAGGVQHDGEIYREEARF